MDTHVLKVQRIPQEHCDTCGPATAAMILASAGVPPVPQAVLSTDIGQPVNGLVSHPDALANAVNIHLPGGPKFIARNSSDQMEGCRAIVSSILGDGLAAAALIDKCIHWVAITGVTFEGSLSAGIRLGGFVIDDPEDSCLGCHNLPGITAISGFVIGCGNGLPSAPGLDWSNMEAWTQTHWKDGCDKVATNGTGRFATVAPDRDVFGDSSRISLSGHCWADRPE